MVINQHGVARIQPGNRRSTRRGWVLIAAAVLAALWIWAKFGQDLKSISGEAESEKRETVEEFVRLHRPEFMKVTKAHYGTLFVVDPVDFSCPPCYEGFEKILGDLTLLVGPEAGQRILLLVRQEDDGAWSDSTAVRRWADIQGFPVPLLMVPDTAYRNFGFRKTGVLVVDSSIQRVLADEIPVERKGYTAIWSRMEERNRVENP